MRLITLRTAAYDAAQVKKEFQDIVLSARQDDFYRHNMYANFGDIGVAVKVSSHAGVEVR
jgi:hypothetical protein